MTENILPLETYYGTTADSILALERFLINTSLSESNKICGSFVRLDRDITCERMAAERTAIPHKKCLKIPESCGYKYQHIETDLTETTSLTCNPFSFEEETSSGSQSDISNTEEIKVYNDMVDSEIRLMETEQICAVVDNVSIDEEFNTNIHKHLNIETMDYLCNVLVSSTEEVNIIEELFDQCNKSLESVSEFCDKHVVNMNVIHDNSDKDKLEDESLNYIDSTKEISTMEVSINNQNDESEISVYTDSQNEESTMEISIDNLSEESTMEVSTDNQIEESTMEVSSDNQSGRSNMEMTTDNQSEESTMLGLTAGQKCESTKSVFSNNQIEENNMEMPTDNQREKSTMLVFTVGQKCESTMPVSSDNQSEDSIMEMPIDYQSGGSSMEITINNQSDGSTMLVFTVGQNEESIIPVHLLNVEHEEELARQLREECDKSAETLTDECEKSPFYSNVEYLEEIEDNCDKNEYLNLHDNDELLVVINNDNSTGFDIRPSQYNNEIISNIDFYEETTGEFVEAYIKYIKSETKPVTELLPHYDFVVSSLNAPDSTTIPTSTNKKRGRPKGKLK